MAKKIIVSVSPDGTITAESAGQQGPSCLDDLALLTSLSPGSTVESSRLTPEYEQDAASRLDHGEYLNQKEEPRP
jgi:hypothetical protein